MFRVGVLVASLLLAAGPVLAADPAPVPPSPIPTTLYFHLLGVQDFPINTQAPDPAWSQDARYGAATSTLTCLPEVPAASLTGQAYHTFYGYANPGVVDYRQPLSGMPRVDATRGLAGDVRLDRAKPVLLHWYIAVDLTSVTGSPADAAAVPVPNVVLRATWRTGDAISVDDSAYETGALVAQAQTDPVTLLGPQVIAPSGQGAQQVQALGLVDGHWLYAFTLPLAPSLDVLPGNAGFNLRVDLFVDNPACSGPGSVMPDEVEIHSAPAERPRLELATGPTLSTVSLVPRLVGGQMVVAAQVASAWGAYDVDADHANLAIAGPGTATHVERVPVLQSSTEHAARGGKEPALMGWAWDLGADHAPAGHYTATLTVPNRQGTSNLTANVEFDLAAAQKSPSPALPFLSVGLMAAAFALRRRAGGRR